MEHANQAVLKLCEDLERGAVGAGDGVLGSCGGDGFEDVVGGEGLFLNAGDEEGVELEGGGGESVGDEDAEGAEEGEEGVG